MREIPPPSAAAASADAAATRAAFRLVFPGVMVAMFLAAADQTILASALPSIAAEQGALADLSWVVVAPAAPRLRIHALDIPGAVLLSIATTCLLFALTSGGHRFAWWSWQLPALFATAVAGFVLLFAWERRHPDPVIPVRLLAMPAIVRSDVVVMCFAAVMFPFIVYLPLYLQLGRGMGIGASGASLLPVTLAQVVSSAVTGRLVTFTGRVTIFPKLGLSVATCALLALAVVAGSGAGSVPMPAFMALTMGVGIGLGMVMPPTQVTVQMAAGRDALGVATGLISLARALGGACGVALAGALLFSLIDAPADGAATVLHRALEGGVGTLTAMPEALRTELAGRIGGAYRAVFMLLAGFAAMGAAMAWTIPTSDWKR